MKANDLMIGDWVLRIDVQNPVPCKIIEIKLDGVTVQNVQSHNVFVEFADIKPIPLTPEILKKNGFNKPVDAGDGTLICGADYPPYKLTFQSIYGLPILTIEDVVDTDLSHTCLVLKDEIYNVHQLQHALRMCGIEKEIKL